jgi:hypothetical protein
MEGRSSEINSTLLRNGDIPTEPRKSTKLKLKLITTQEHFWNKLNIKTIFLELSAGPGLLFGGQTTNFVGYMYDLSSLTIWQAKKSQFKQLLFCS